MMQMRVYYRNEKLDLCEFLPVAAARYMRNPDWRRISLREYRAWKRARDFKNQLKEVLGGHQL